MHALPLNIPHAEKNKSMPINRLQRIQDQVISALTVSLLTASVGFLWNISVAVTDVSKGLALLRQTTEGNTTELKLHSQTLVDYGNRIIRLEMAKPQDKNRRQYSIKNTLEVLDFGFGVGGAVKSAKADGKIDANDLVHLIPLLPLAGPAFEDIGSVPKELGELSDEESKQVLDHCRPKVAGLISDEELAKKINAGLKLGMALAEFLSVL